MQVSSIIILLALWLLCLLPSPPSSPLSLHPSIHTSRSSPCVVLSSLLCPQDSSAPASPLGRMSDDEEEDTYFACIDFEATCGSSIPNAESETIEFPCVLVQVSSRNGNITNVINFVRPEEHPILDEFCKQLTGIHDSDLKDAPTLSEVMDNFNSWIHELELDDDEFVVVTCGSYDVKILLQPECTRKDIPLPAYFENFINLKDSFKKFYNNHKAGSGLTKMVDFLGLTWEGQHHRGIDDSRNLANVLVKIIYDGFLNDLEING